MKNEKQKKKKIENLECNKNLKIRKIHTFSIFIIISFLFPNNIKKLSRYIHDKWNKT